MKLKATYKQIGLAILILAIALTVYLMISRDIEKPLKTSYEFSSLSGVFTGVNERTYVIDGAKKKLLVLDGDSALKTVIHGEKEDEGFYYASLVCDDLENNIYVADTLYTEMGTILAAESIIKYDQKGRFKEIVYEIKYDDSEFAPLQYGNIQSLSEVEGQLIFTIKRPGGLNVVRLDLTTGEKETKSYDLGDSQISSAGVDLESLLPVFITRTGDVCSVKADLSIDILVSGHKAGTPWKLDYFEGEVYYTDLSSSELNKVNLEGINETVFQAEETLYTVSVKDGEILTTDYIGIYALEGKDVAYKVSVEAGSILKSAAFLLSILMILLTSLFLLLNIAYLLKDISKNKSFQKSMIIITVSLFIAALVVYLSLSNMLQVVNHNTMRELNFFCEIMVEATDVEALSEIKEVSDHGGASYLEVKNQLDKIAHATYESELYYYYVLYRHEGEMIYGVMDYEDTMTTKHPFYSWGGNDYTEVFEKQISIEVSNDVSTYGTWSFILKPVMDQEGNVIAVMEVGVNTDELQKKQKGLIKDIIITIACSVIVMIIIMLEIVFFLQYKDRKGKYVEKMMCPTGFRFPVRSLIFLAFLADSMQDAFMPILASKRYEMIFNIPRGIGIALPITAQLFMSAVFAFLGGTIITRIGVKKTLLNGFLAQLLGFAVCAFSSSYVSLLIGKSFIGIGMGLIIVCVNAIAAVSENESALTFGEINAGILAGVTAGVGVGSVILSIGNYATVYVVGASILLLGFIMALLGEDYLPSISKRVKDGASILKFVVNKKTATFLLLILMPFLIALSYREYFFPLYAQHMGISESNIGYLYLICGLIVIYMGPFLTKTLIDKWGVKITIIASSLLMCVASLLFATVSSLATAIIGVIILSFAISFGYAAQSTYYTSLPMVSNYGEARSMGVYTLFDCGGQTLGPIIYGSVMVFGYRPSVAFVGGGLTILLLIFIVANYKRGDR